MKGTILALLLLAGCEPRVVDGDTIDFAGSRWRLVGYDSPELYADKSCERIVAKRAKNRLAELIHASRHTELTEVPCATRNYGRRCAVLRLDGRDASDLMQAAGLAHPYDCTRGCPPKRKWC